MAAHAGPRLTFAGQDLQELSEIPSEDAHAHTGVHGETVPFYQEHDSHQPSSVTNLTKQFEYC